MKLYWSDAGIDFPATEKIMETLNEWYSDDYLTKDEVEEKLCTEDAMEIKKMFSEKEWEDIFDKLASVNCEVWYPEDNEPITVGIVRLLCTYVAID